MSRLLTCLIQDACLNHFLSGVWFFAALIRCPVHLIQVKPQPVILEVEVLQSNGLGEHYLLCENNCIKAFCGC